MTDCLAKIIACIIVFYDMFFFCIRFITTKDANIIDNNFCRIHFIISFCYLYNKRYQTNKRITENNQNNSMKFTIFAFRALYLFLNIFLYLCFVLYFIFVSVRLYTFQQRNIYSESSTKKKKTALFFLLYILSHTLS